MEVEQISYIFGSFSRRRQAEDSGSVKRRSLSGGAVKRASTPGAGGAEGEQDEGQFRCAMCRQAYVEPRVLPCLHTFCTRCLQRLRPLEEGGVEDESDGKNIF